ncbi:MAG: reductive dehalogenase [Treponema sp.]|nr:reductive dehalogenase [Treponema sp.]
MKQNESNEKLKISRRNFLRTVGVAGATAASAGLFLSMASTRTDTGPNSKLDDTHPFAPWYKKFDQHYDGRKMRRWNEENRNLMMPLALQAGEIHDNRPALEKSIRDAMGTVTRSFGSNAGLSTGNGGLYSWEPLGITSPPKQRWEGSSEEAAMILKRFSHDCGAVDTGITLLDERLVHSHWYENDSESGEIIISDTAEKPQQLPDGTRLIPSSMKYVIVQLCSMPYDMIQTSTSTIATGAANLGYSMMAFVTPPLAEFIRGLGWQAIPAGASTVSVIPLAIAAGLGEYGRNGLLINPEYGPRVRITTVITDLPLATDNIMKFGVQNFCESCMACAENCPAQAIPYGSMTWEGNSVSNNHGAYKWYIDATRCHMFEASNGGPCSNCIRTCAYNKPPGFWTHDPFGLRVASILGGNIMAKMDELMGYGRVLSQEDFWRKKSRG